MIEQAVLTSIAIASELSSDLRGRLDCLQRLFPLQRFIFAYFDAYFILWLKSGIACLVFRVLIGVPLLLSRQIVLHSFTDSKQIASLE